MQLQSQGSMNLLSTTLLNPARSYIRSYDFKKRYNVHASYYTVGLQMKERRQALVVTIAAILGSDSRYWFAPSLKPVNLPAHPLDWSTTLLQQLCTFAESIPLDVRNTAIDQRLVLAHQFMLTEAVNSSTSDSSPNSTSTRRQGKPSRASKEHEELCHLCAQNADHLDQIKALRDEHAILVDQKVTDDREIVGLKDLLGRLAAALSNCQRELETLGVRNAWTERSLALRDLVQTVPTE